jgi:hypothetical protein
LRIRVSSLVFWFSFKGNWVRLEVRFRKAKPQASVPARPAFFDTRPTTAATFVPTRSPRGVVRFTRLFAESGVKDRAGGCGICARRFKIATRSISDFRFWIFDCAEAPTCSTYSVR